MYIYVYIYNLLVFTMRKGPAGAGRRGKTENLNFMLTSHVCMCPINKGYSVLSGCDII